MLSVYFKFKYSISMVDDKLARFNMITSSSSDSARCTIKSRTFERFNLTLLIIDVSYINSITKGIDSILGFYLSSDTK